MSSPTRATPGDADRTNPSDRTDRSGGADDYIEASGVLVSVAGTVHDPGVVRAAGAHAAVTGGHLVVLAVLPNDAFVERQRARAAVPELRRFALSEAEMERRHVARRAARRALGGVDVPVTVVGAVGREPDHVLATAREHGCDHVFLADRPAPGRALTRDTLSAVCERFEGPVTVLSERDGESDRPTPL
ncbi:universal stress protein [Halomarina litorea]|uniref:universal stress protein n=1 Tax=Halomarina litorea TaxID=2961595 RepID=UPI0020C3A22A|nr:universal stress protein [Halomarina sp. BCD28]